MYIKNLRLENFRCHEQLEISFAQPLTVVVGENDIGKTTILDALDIVFNHCAFTSQDIRSTHDDSERKPSSICITLSIKTSQDLPDYCLSGPAGNELVLTRRFDGSVDQWLLLKNVPTNSRFDNYQKLSASESKSLIKEELGEEPESNSQSRIEQIRAAIQSERVPMEFRNCEIKWTDVQPLLPQLERISSLEYQAPESLVRRTFQTVSGQIIKDPSTGELIGELQSVESQIHRALNQEVKTTNEILKRKLPNFKEIKIIPTIDFSKAITGASILVDTGEGLHNVQVAGAGTQRRIWMGLLEWENKTRQHDKPLIRLYDEPDSNLHYEAQRKLFDEIKRATTTPNALCQTIICTHSLAILDRAPLSSIRLLQRKSDTNQRVCMKFAEQDHGAPEFYNDLGSALGLSNSAILYERAFLLVEGKSEVDALAHLYKSLYGASMRDDGIVLINLHTCTAWRSVLDVLLYNRKSITHLVLDSDCLSDNSSARISKKTLQEGGYNEDFFNNNISFIGQKEFEDLFSFAIICETANTYYPREDSRAWIESDFLELQNSDKFSAKLVSILRTTSEKSLRSQIRKPDIALFLAKTACENNEVPPAIHDVFKKVRHLAGLSSNTPTQNDNTSTDFNGFNEDLLEAGE